MLNLFLLSCLSSSHFHTLFFSQGTKDLTQEKKFIKEKAVAVIIEIVVLDWPNNWKDLLDQLVAIAKRGVRSPQTSNYPFMFCTYVCTDSLLLLFMSGNSIRISADHFESSCRRDKGLQCATVREAPKRYEHSLAKCLARHICLFQKFHHITVHIVHTAWFVSL